jgi:NifU-like protein involved in Fe-S cluster formation
MSEELSLLVKEYMAHPVYNKSLDSYSYCRHEWNALCGDDINVYVVLEWDVIVAYGFDGNCSMITSAAASFLWDLMLGAAIWDVLSRTSATLLAEWFEVSRRRIRSSVLALMAVQNWYYRMIESHRLVGFEDLVDSE